MNGIIYCAKFPNGKKYYGRTKNSLQDRINKHIRDSKISNLLFHRALRKYKDNVKWDIIEEINENLLNEREKYWIEKDKTNVFKFGIKYGYNLTEGGEGGEGGDTFSNKSHSKKTREKMSKSRIKWIEENGHQMSGRKRPDHSKRMSGKLNPMFGNGHKISGEKNGNFGREFSEDHKKNISNSLKGRKLSEETKRKMSESHKKRF
jgi:hypothetical protein